MSESIPDDIRKASLDVLEPYQKWLTFDEHVGLAQAIALALLYERLRHHEQEEISSVFDRWVK